MAAVYTAVSIFCLTMFTLLSIHFFDRPMDALIAHIRRSVLHNDHSYVCVTGLHGLFEAQQNKDFQKILNAAGFTVCDGTPIVCLGKIMRKPDIERIYGPDLLLGVCSMAEKNNMSIFLFGTTTQTLMSLSLRLQTLFPRLIIAGSYAPPFHPFTDKEHKEMYRLINASGARIVFVGLSTPKQERWMHLAKPNISTNVSIGVGAAFDFIAGTKRQAPKWIRTIGFEWVFRLLTEPRRLGKRYAIILFNIVKVVIRKSIKKLQTLFSAQ